MSMEMLLTAIDATEDRLATLDPQSPRWAIEAEHLGKLRLQLDRVGF